MSNSISRRYNFSSFSWSSLFWTLPLYALTFLVLVSAEYYLSNNGFNLLASGLWYFPKLLAMAYLPIFLIQITARAIFKMDELHVGDRVEIVNGEYCGFTGQILQVYRGQNATRVLVKTMSGTTFDLILKRNQFYKLPSNIANKKLSI